MKILIDIAHPAHVHLFKNIYFHFSKKGKVVVTTRNIPVILSLLKFYKIPFIVIGKKRNSIFGKAISVFLHDLRVLGIVLANKINLGISSGIILSHVSMFSGMKSIIFDDDDDEIEPLIVKFAHPFAHLIVSPDSIKRKRKNVKYYAGTHELTYLHPNYFKPDREILKKYNIDPEEKYFIMRFVSFKGHHDIGHSGISLSQKLKLVNLLSNYGRVFITTESKIEPELEAYKLPVEAQEIHSVMYFSSMFIGDSQTMTSEAAILGVPSYKCNTFAGSLSVPNELEKKYQLCYSFLPKDFDKFYNLIETDISDVNLKEKWNLRLKKFMEEKTDATKILIKIIEEIKTN